MTKDELREFYEGISFMPDASLAEWTARLNAGERGPQAEGLATIIIKDFILRTLLDKPQSKITLEWLADALEKILAFEDPRQALTLPKRAKHRPAGEGILKAIDVAYWMRLAMDRGYSEKEAVELAAKRFACTERHVRRVRVQASGWAGGMNLSAPWEDFFLQKRRPLPPRKPPDAN